MTEPLAATPVERIRRLRGVWRLPARHQWLLVQAAILLPALRLMLAATGLRRVHAALYRLGTRSGATGPGRWSSPRQVQAAVRMVEMAARHSPFSNTCLHRSLALWWLLRRRRVPCEIRFGARRGAGGFDAHAWVEHEGVVINDDRRVVEAYAPLSWVPVGRRP